MQIINKTVQCPECGCIAFPDAIYCPKCGTSYREGKTKKEIRWIFEKMSFQSTQLPVYTDKSPMQTYCQLICPHHGLIDIRTTVVIPTIKCPLCQGS